MIRRRRRRVLRAQLGRRQMPVRTVRTLVHPHRTTSTTVPLGARRIRRQLRLRHRPREPPLPLRADHPRRRRTTRRRIDRTRRTPRTSRAHHVRPRLLPILQATHPRPLQLRPRRPVPPRRVVLRSVPTWHDRGRYTVTGSNPTTANRRTRSTSAPDTASTNTPPRSTTRTNTTPSTSSVSAARPSMWTTVPTATPITPGTSHPMVCDGGPGDRVAPLSRSGSITRVSRPQPRPHTCRP